MIPKRDYTSCKPAIMTPKSAGADPQTINGLNLYTYCGNDPVMYTDPYGTTEWWEWLVGGFVVAGLVVGTILTSGAVAAVFAGAAIGGAISYGTQVVSGELDWGQFALDIGVGAITGLIGASGVSKATATVLGGLIGSGSSIASDLINGKSVSLGKVVMSGVIGTFAGFLGGAGVKNIDGLSSSIFKGFSSELTKGIVNNLINKAPNFLLSLQSSLFRGAMFWYAVGTIGNFFVNLII